MSQLSLTGDQSILPVCFLTLRLELDKSKIEKKKNSC